ncbi:MAG TPA: slipin family protein [Armatimonadetes bacterium]|jgi:regulator of protease activity HflC (stomatin/prohibitin superfamily)|nr:slipin family protein [Armatimonadota bacterium]
MGSLIEALGPFAFFLLVAAVFVITSAVKVVREYERGVIFRLGRLVGAKGPGLFFIIPGIDAMTKMDLRVITMNVPKQEGMTRDNVPVTVDAVVYFRVVNPSDAVVKVENYAAATSMYAQTTLRSVIGQVEMDQLLSERDEINRRIQGILDQHTEPWGVKVTATEIRDVVLPDGMKRAMARQAETERERRSKIIAAEGEFQAAEKIAQAAAVIGREPVGLQLRYLQSLSEIATEHNSTTIFPIPIDLFKPFIQGMQSRADANPAPAVSGPAVRETPASEASAGESKPEA